MHCQLCSFLEIQFDPRLLEGSQTSAESPTQRGTPVSQELDGSLDGSLLPVVVTGSGLVYILSLAIFCVCRFLCGRCALKHKESTQPELNVASHKTERQVHQPPRYPAPIYKDVQPAKANSVNQVLSSILPMLHHVTQNNKHIQQRRRVQSQFMKLCCQWMEKPRRMSLRYNYRILR